MREPPEEIREGVERLLAECGGGILHERIARGGGATRWWWCRSLDDFMRTYDELRPGSRVVLYVGSEVQVAPLTDREQEQIWSIAAERGEVLFGPQRPGTNEYDAIFLGHAELEEAFARVPPGDRVLWGQQPATETGRDAFAFTPPDADGVVRPQPV